MFLAALCHLELFPTTDYTHERSVLGFLQMLISTSDTLQRQAYIEDKYFTMHSSASFYMQRCKLCSGSIVNSKYMLIPSTLGEYLNSTRKDDHCYRGFVFSSP